MSTQKRDDLSEEEKHIMFEKGTEAPFSGKFVDTKEKGIYVCKNCSTKLFSSDAKFDSRTGWPSFDTPASRERVVLIEDESHSMRRTEVTCATCGAHLGHVFPDGPTSTGQRYCINSACLDLRPDEK